MILIQNFYGFYQKARNASWQVLLDFDIRSLPVNILTIANRSNITVVKNSIAHELEENEAGLSVLERNRWYIVYDDTNSKERSRFTIAHELGHIFLGHPLNFGYHARTTSKRKPKTESEADVFASRLLAPACVLWGLDLHTPEEISKYCGISLSAAQIRADRMKILYERQKFLTSPLEKKVFVNFKEYINQNRR